MGNWLHVLRDALARLASSLPGLGGFPADRRRHARLTISVPVECWLEGAAGDRLAGVTENLSEDGLCLLCNSVFLGGQHVFHPHPGRPRLRQTPLVLEATLPDGQRARTRAEPVWFDRAAEGSAWRFRVGVRFVEVPPEARAALDHLLHDSARMRVEPGVLLSGRPLTPPRPAP
ncbi:MAG: PilZ domain-containing protein [Deltaproteobacteria bacterium]|nr:PilZ domain-containing protein [Deltaproteobacteria bacterium]